jgi:hypothetical protein
MLFWHVHSFSQAMQENKGRCHKAVQTIPYVILPMYNLGFFPGMDVKCLRKTTAFGIAGRP